MFKVFEKGCFYCEKTESDKNEREILDSDLFRAVMQRDGSILIIEQGVYGVCEFHEIKNDEDSEYRVERNTN